MNYNFIYGNRTNERYEKECGKLRKYIRKLCAVEYAVHYKIHELIMTGGENVVRKRVILRRHSERKYEPAEIFTQTYFCRFRHNLIRLIRRGTNAIGIARVRRLCAGEFFTSRESEFAANAWWLVSRVSDENNVIVARARFIDVAASCFASRSSGPDNRDQCH